VVAHDRKSEQGAFPVFPVSAPVTRQFGARGFSFAVSMTFPVFGAPRRPVNRLYFFYNGPFTGAQPRTRGEGQLRLGFLM
jgi:hypothetical protein